MSAVEREPCPACGGTGGERHGASAAQSPGWDVETFECVACGGSGTVREVAAAPGEDAAPVARPGLAKTTPERRAAEETKKKISGA